MLILWFWDHPLLSSSRFDADCVMKNIFEIFDSQNTGRVIDYMFLPININICNILNIWS